MIKKKSSVDDSNSEDEDLAIERRMKELEQMKMTPKVTFMSMLKQ